MVFLTMPARGIKPFAGVLSPPVPELPRCDISHYMSGIQQSLPLTRLCTRVKRQEQPRKTSWLCAFVFCLCHPPYPWWAGDVSCGEGRVPLLAKIPSQEVFLLQE